MTAKFKWSRSKKIFLTLYHNQTTHGSRPYCYLDYRFYLYFPYCKCIFANIVITLYNYKEWLQLWDFRYFPIRKIMVIDKTNYSKSTYRLFKCHIAPVSCWFVDYDGKIRFFGKKISLRGRCALRSGLREFSLKLS